MRRTVLVDGIEVESHRRDLTAHGPLAALCAEVSRLAGRRAVPAQLSTQSIASSPAIRHILVHRTMKQRKSIRSRVRHWPPTKGETSRRYRTRTRTPSGYSGVPMPRRRARRSHALHDRHRPSARRLPHALLRRGGNSIRGFSALRPFPRTALRGSTAPVTARPRGVNCEPRPPP